MKTCRGGGNGKNNHHNHVPNSIKRGEWGFIRRGRRKNLETLGDRMKRENIRRSRENLCDNIE